MEFSHSTLLTPPVDFSSFSQEEQVLITRAMGVLYVHVLENFNKLLDGMEELGKEAFVSKTSPGTAEGRIYTMEMDGLAFMSKWLHDTCKIE